MSKSKEKFFGWWIAFAGFMIIGTLYTLTGNTIGLFLVPLAEAVDASRGQVSMLAPVSVIELTIVSLFVNKLIKKVGIKLVVTIGGVLGTIGFILMARVNSLFELYIAAIILGVSMGLCTIVPVNLMLNNWFIEKKGLITGIVFAGSGFGGFIFSQLINYIISTSGFRTAFLVLGVIVGVVIIPIGLFIVTLTPEDKNQKPYGYKNINLNTKNETVKGYSLSEIKGKKSFNMLLISIFIIVFINAAVMFQMPAHLLDSGYDMSFVANINSILLAGLVITKLILGSIFDKKGGLYSVAVGGVCYSVGCLILALTSNQIAVIIFAIIYSMGAALVTLAPPFLTSDLYGKKDYGSIFGIVTVANSIGAALGGPVLGFIYDASGSYNIGWMLLAVLSICLIGFVSVSYKSFKTVKQAI